MTSLGIQLLPTRSVTCAMTISDAKPESRSDGICTYARVATVSSKCFDLPTDLCRQSLGVSVFVNDCNNLCMCEFSTRTDPLRASDCNSRISWPIIRYRYSDKPLRCKVTLHMRYAEFAYLPPVTCCDAPAGLYFSS